jgi:uncharacterized protein with HEPN domain
MSKDSIEYLKHIRDECDYLVSVMGDGVTQEVFLQDETLKRAVVRSLEIIGEATKNIPADFRVQYATIQWKSMAGMRDRLIHNYMGVNYLLVWDVVENKIPELYQQIIEVIENP